MSLQCPACDSYNENAAAFCSQCGGGLGRGAAGGGGFGVRSIWVTLAILTVAAAGAGWWWMRSPEETVERRPPDVAPEVIAEGPGEAVEVEADEAPSPPRDRPKPAEAGDEDVPAPLDPAEIRRNAEVSLAVLELRDENDRPLADAQGILVGERGAVLCRLRPLLGAYRGDCRLGGRERATVPIVGVSHYDEGANLALLRIDTGRRPAIHVPILPDPVADTLLPDEELWAFSGFHQKKAVIDEVWHVTLDGTAGVLLAESPPVPPESFAAIDGYGFLVGLCTAVVDGIAVGRGRAAVGRGDGASPSSGTVRVLVEPVVGWRAWTSAPVSLTLSELTQELFRGTFVDLMTRADEAMRRKAWGEAFELLLRAIERGSFDEVESTSLDLAYRRAKEAALQEVERLMGAGRGLEAADIARRALAYHPEDVALWTALGVVEVERGAWREGIDALLHVRTLDPSARVESRLESAYLAFAGKARRGGDVAFAEALLAEAAEQLPGSGKVRFELALLYQEWEAWEDAVRVYRDAKRLEPALASQVDAQLDRIDDVLARRDALILPIRGSLIRADALIDGRREFPFIVDTGATHTTVPASYADALGYDLDRAEPIRLRTAGGVILGRRIVVGAVSVGGYTVSGLEVVVLPSEVSLDTGLLGHNFLEHFRYSVDTARGEFRLERR